jgi:hypothetical protein
MNRNYPAEWSGFAQGLADLRFDHVDVVIELGIPLIVENGERGVAKVGSLPAMTAEDRASAILVELLLLVVQVVEGPDRVRPMGHTSGWPNTAKMISKGANQLGQVGAQGIFLVTMRALPAIQDQLETRQRGRPWAESGEEIARACMLWFLGTLLTGSDANAPAVFGWGPAGIALPERLGVSLFPE